MCYTVLYLHLYCTVYTLSPHRRRRMELEDKAKVVASVSGAEFVNFLAALAVVAWVI